MKTNTKVTEAVVQYADEIVSSVKQTKYDIEIELDYMESTSADGKQGATQAVITSELGIVVVFPDFKKKSASAATLNVGLMRAMEKEGYDQETIEKQGQVYSKLLPYSTVNAELLAYYLTHKINVRPNSKELDRDN
jgi:hypothetical protein